MINPENMFIIAKKELKSYFDSPVAYIVLVVFLLLWEYLFFRNAFIVGEASLRSMFSLLPWLLLLLAPALTMGSIAQEKSENTLEVLLTHSVRDEELVVGKFIGSLIFVTCALLFVVPVAYAFGRFGNLDGGEVTGQLLGGFGAASVMLALGIFISGLVRNQVAALLIAVGASFVLIIVGFELVTDSLPLVLAPVLEGLSVTTHFDSMARGVVDVRDTWYFLSATVVFLSLAYLSLLKRRFGNQRSRYRTFTVGIALFIAIAIVTNFIGNRIPGRLDLTQGNRYTLSPETKQTLSNLPDIVNITLFASGRLPAQLQPNLREVKDTLRDYDTLGADKLIVTTKDPQANSDVEREAQSAGVQAVQFNVVGQEQLQVQSGYLGVVIAHGGKSESIPFVQNPSELEYQLTSFIRQLTITEKKTVTFLTGFESKSRMADMRTFNGEIEKQFEVDDINVEGSSFTVPEKTRVLIVAGPTGALDEATITTIRDYIESGGSTLLLIDRVAANPQFFTASPVQNNLGEILSGVGITAQTDLVYDLRSFDTVRFGNGLISYALPYPLWPRALVPSDARDVAGRAESVLMPWASSLAVDEGKVQGSGYSLKKLLVSSPFAGLQKSPFSLAPDQDFAQDDLSERVLAVGLEKDKARVVVIGDSDFLTDQFTQNSPENLAFGVGALSWLSQEESLAGLRVKQAVNRKLLFSDPSQIALVKYMNLALVALGVPAVGVIRLMRRRKRQQFVYRHDT